jgi:hypothetical protein
MQAGGGFREKEGGRVGGMGGAARVVFELHHHGPGRSVPLLSPIIRSPEVRHSPPLQAQQFPSGKLYANPSYGWVGHR